MSLVLCQECEREVSDMALFCPGCGWPVRDIINSLKGKNARSRFHFNPLIRPGKIRWILGATLVYLGVSLFRDPTFFGTTFTQFFGPKLVLEPMWFWAPGGVLMFWAALRGMFWGCSNCKGILPGRKATRCPFCLLPLPSNSDKTPSK